MRFLADENFPRDAVAHLRSAGHDVWWVTSERPGIADSEVLRQAVMDGRVLLTFDKDFGDLAFHAGLPATCGIVLFRLPTLTSPQTAAVVSAALSNRSDWEGHFSVVELGRIRMRSLPTPTSVGPSP